VDAQVAAKPIASSAYLQAQAAALAVTSRTNQRPVVASQEASEDRPAWMLARRITKLFAKGLGLDEIAQFTTFAFASCAD
jgi:hypothetical protein